jgi:hypothetical protein
MTILIRLMLYIIYIARIVSLVLKRFTYSVHLFGCSRYRENPVLIILSCSEVEI